ncbi:MAG: rhodanese-like domain-containing protein [Candidatus Gracilibacteria bacterium]|nr:rhodanese-like domain-containing protein [Candidatus Gracilibacteria bacterium]
MKHLLLSIIILGVTTSCTSHESTSKNTTIMNNTAFENFSGIDVKNFINLYETSEYTLIDIRTLEEINKGKIKNTALEIDFYAETFKNDINSLDKSKKYLVYCRSGNRSGKTMSLMKELNFENAYHLSGGIMAYENQ